MSARPSASFVAIAVLALATAAPAQNRPQFPEMRVTDAGVCVDLQPIDLNGDGHLDLAWAGVCLALGTPVPVDLYSALGDGTGALSAPVGHTVGTGPQQLALGDLDGDGDPDALVTNFDSDDVSVLLGDGAGGFGPACRASRRPGR